MGRMGFTIKKGTCESHRHEEESSMLHVVCYKRNCLKLRP